MEKKNHCILVAVGIQDSWVRGNVQMCISWKMYGFVFNRCCNDNAFALLRLLADFLRLYTHPHCFFASATNVAIEKKSKQIAIPAGMEVQIRSTRGRPLTFINNNAWHLFLGWGRTFNPVSLHQAAHLSQVFKGAIHTSRKFWHVLGFQHQLHQNEKCGHAEVFD